MLILSKDFFDPGFRFVSCYCPYNGIVRVSTHHDNYIHWTRQDLLMYQPLAARTKARHV
jgi:hypothetical protein